MLGNVDLSMEVLERKMEVFMWEMVVFFAGKNGSMNGGVI